MLKKDTRPRGIRNNNGGNIRWDGRTQWQGMIGQDDKGFIIFDNPEHGIRAITRILKSYARRGVQTVPQIINTWAPPNGVEPLTGETYTNNTTSYINNVLSKTKLRPSDKVTADKYAVLIDAIIKHENGQQPYTEQQIKTGIALA